MIKNIIFDIGGVLLEYNPKTYLDKLNIEEEKRKDLNNIIFHNQKWRDCLNGLITNVEIYNKLIEKYNLNIKESIFIDDTKINIISADEIGFKTILFSDIEQVKDILRVN